MTNPEQPDRRPGGGTAQRNGWASWLLASLHGYRRGWLRGDLLAGLTVWAVLVPEALAYATIAGVSPVVGLYAAPAALLLYALFGTSRHLVTGPMAATAALSAAAVGTLAPAGSKQFTSVTAALALTVGVLALLAGLLRLGFLANFISEPVLKGFIIGLALTIMIGQVPKLFGVHKTEGDFFRQLAGLLSKLGDTHAVTLAVGTSSLLLVLLLRRFAPALPASLIVVVLGIAAVHLFNLAAHGIAIVGHIDRGLPPLGLPNGLSWHDYGQLAGPAVGIMLVGFAEGLGAAKTYAAREHYEIDANRELISLGAANLGAGMSAGMVVNGSLSKTAVNGSAGARSQLSGLLVAALTIITLLFLTGLFEDLPDATLAAVVIAALIDLVDLAALTRLYRLYTSELGRIYGLATRVDFLAALAAMLGVLIFDTLPGLFIGIAVSVLLLIYRSSRPHVAVLGRDPGGHWVDVRRHAAAQVDGVLVVRPEGGLYYANADEIRRTVLGQITGDTRTVVLDAQTVPMLDVTAADMLSQLTAELDARHIQLRLARDIGQVRDMLTKAGGNWTDRLYPTVTEAVAGPRRPPQQRDTVQQAETPSTTAQ